MRSFHLKLLILMQATCLSGRTSSLAFTPGSAAFDGGRNLRLAVVASLAKLPQPWDQVYQTELRVVGLKPGKYQLVINDEPPVELTAEELSHCSLTVQPDGKVWAGR